MSTILGNLEIGKTYQIIFQTKRPVNREKLGEILSHLHRNAIELTKRDRRISLKVERISPNTKNRPDASHRIIEMSLFIHSNPIPDTNLSVVPIIAPAVITAPLIIKSLLTGLGLVVSYKAITVVEKIPAKDIKEIATTVPHSLKWIAIIMGLYILIPIIRKK